MSVVFNNTWASISTLEVQRADLWNLDMSQVLSYLQALPVSFYTASNLDKNLLPTIEELTVSIKNSAFPVQSLKLQQVTQNSVPRNFPGYFDVLDSSRTDFIHANDECLYTFLNSWRALSRLGIVGESGESVNLLPNESFVPTFKFNLYAKFLGGSSTGNFLNFTSVFALNGCWLRGYQPAILDLSSGSQAYVITAQIQPDEIVPYLP